MRIESALAIELQRTFEIIKRTHLFDNADRIFGEPGAKYSNNPPGQDGMGGGLGGGGGAPMPVGDGFGDELGDLGEPGSDTEGDLGGDEGGADLGGMDANAPAPLSEARKLLSEESLNAISKNQYYKAYLKDVVDENERTGIPILDKNLRINEEIETLLKGLEVNKSSENTDMEEEIDVLLQ